MVLHVLRTFKKVYEASIPENSWVNCVVRKHNLNFTKQMCKYLAAVMYTKMYI